MGDPTALPMLENTALLYSPGFWKGFPVPEGVLSPARGVWKWCKFSSSELCISGCFEPCTEHFDFAACPGSLTISYLSPEQMVFHQITALLLSRTKILRGICYSMILICPQCFDMLSVPIPMFSFFSLNVTFGSGLLQTANGVFVFTYGNFNIFPNTSAFFHHCGY